MAETIKNRVLQVLGEDTDYLSGIPKPHQLFEEAIWEAALTLPETILMLESEDHINPQVIGDTEAAHSSLIEVDDMKVLKVIRVTHLTSLETDADYHKRECLKITYSDSIKAKDVNSIHFATAESPVYWIENTGTGVPKVKVFPEAGGTSTGESMAEGETAVEIYLYPREALTNDAPDADPATDWDLITEFNGIPIYAEEFVVMRIAMKVLEHKMANAGTQDEDQEVLTILGAVNQNLTQQITISLEQLKNEWGVQK